MPGGGGGDSNHYSESSHELDNNIFLNCCQAALLSVLAGYRYYTSYRPVSVCLCVCAPIALSVCLFQHRSQGEWQPGGTVE